MKNGTFFINLHYKKGRNSLGFFICRQKYSCFFNSFWIEYNSQEVLSKIKDKFHFSSFHPFSSPHNNQFRIESDDSIICEFYCVSFYWMYSFRINFVRLHQFIYPNYYQKNGKYISTLKINMTKKNISFGFRSKHGMDDTRNYLLELVAFKVLISKALIYPYINHDELVSVNNVLKKYNVTKEKIKYLENTVKCSI